MPKEGRVFTQTFGVVGAIIERSGKILLVKENVEGHPDFGKWNQPAGWLEVGEHPIDGVAREVKEETGFDFTPTHLLGVYSLVRRHHPKKELTAHPLKLIFIGNISGSQGKLQEDVSEARWFSPEEIFTMKEDTLRDLDIKDEVRDYFAGKRYPLDVIVHTVAE